MIQIKYRIDHSHYGFFTASTCKAHAALTSNKKKKCIWITILSTIYICVCAPAHIQKISQFLIIKVMTCVGSWFEGSFTVDVSKPKPNRPNTMNLVEKRAQELGLCEDFINGRPGSLGSRIVKGVEEGWKSVLGPRLRMSSSSPPLILHN